MTLTIELSNEVEAGLKRLAALKGREPEDYATQLLAQQVNNELSHTDELEDPQALSRAIARMKERTPEQIATAREKILQKAKPPRPLPEGQTNFDALRDKIQSDETDEEVFTALEKLS